MIAANTVILAAAPGDEEHLSAAKEYIQQHNLSSEDVKLTQSQALIKIITKREVSLAEGNQRMETGPALGVEGGGQTL